MGKPTGDIERIVIETKAPGGPAHGLDVDLSGRGNKLAAIGILLLLGCPMAWLVMGAPWPNGSPKAVPAPRPAPWPGWTILWRGFVAILAIAIIAYVIARLWLSFQAYRARVHAEKVKAMRVDHDENGLAPWLIKENGDAANLNAAPAGVVNGLMGKKTKIDIPDPETDDRRAAGQRAATLQALVASGPGSVPLPQGPMMGGDLPKVQVLEEDPAHVERLLLQSGAEEGDGWK